MDRNLPEDLMMMKMLLAMAVFFAGVAFSSCSVNGFSIIPAPIQTSPVRARNDASSSALSSPCATSSSNGTTVSTESNRSSAASASHKPQTCSSKRGHENDDDFSSSTSVSSAHDGSSDRPTQTSSSTVSTAENSSYPSGAVAEYLFSGNTRDTSGYGNHGVLKGTAFYTNDRFGNPDSAIYMHDHSEIDAGDGQVLRSIRDQVSASLWVSGDSRGRICGKLDNGNPATGGWMVEIDAYGRPEVWVVRTNAYLQFLLPEPLSAGDWHHIAFTASAKTGTVRLYIDGVAHETNGIQDMDLQYVPEAWNQGCSNLTLGYAWGGGWVWQTGILDDVRVYNYERTAAELQDESAGRKENGR